MNLRRGVDEIGIVTSIAGDLAPKISVGQEIIRIDPALNLLKCRPSRDPSKTKAELVGSLRLAQEMCKEMVEADHKAARRMALLKEHDLELLCHLKTGKIRRKFCCRS